MGRRNGGRESKQSGVCKEARLVIVLIRTINAQVHLKQEEYIHVYTLTRC